MARKRKRKRQSLFVEYGGGVDSEKDGQIIALCEEQGGEFMGSGFMLSGDGPRDLDFEFEFATQAEKAAKQIERLNLGEVSISDVEDS